MICPVKPIKNQRAKTTSIDHAFALPKRVTPDDSIAWSPILAGPFVVPVIRWVE